MTMTNAGPCCVCKSEISLPDELYRWEPFGLGRFARIAGDGEIGESGTSRGRPILWRYLG